LYPSVTSMGPTVGDMQDHMQQNPMFNPQMNQMQTMSPAPMGVNPYVSMTSLPYAMPQSYFQPPPQPNAYGFIKPQPVVVQPPTVPVPRPPPPTQHRPLPIQVRVPPTAQAKKSRFGKELWNSEILKKRDESVINELYFDFPLQCKNCGLRFVDRHKMDLHLDWHFVQNRKEKEKTRKAMSRSWYLAKEEWISAADTAEKSAVPFPFGDVIPQEEKKEVVCVPADETQTHCPKCGESFEQFWDSDQDEWMYKDCVSLNDTIYHQKCSTESVDLKPKFEQPKQFELTLTTDSSKKTAPLEVINQEMPPLEDNDTTVKKRSLEVGEADEVEQKKRSKESEIIALDENTPLV